MNITFSNGVAVKIGALIQRSKQTDTYKGATVVNGKLSQPVIVKMSQDAEHMAVIRHEAEALEALNIAGTPNLVASGDITWQGHPQAALVLSFIPGKNVANLRTVVPDGRFSAKQTSLFLKQAARILQQAHANGWAHGDIKMGNCMIGPNGVFIIDWATAIHTSGKAIERTEEEQVATLQYASPEQVRREPLTTATDIYSLAAVAATMHYGAWITPRFNMVNGKPVERTKLEIAAAERSREGLKFNLLALPKGTNEAWLYHTLQRMAQLNPADRMPLAEVANAG